MFKQNINKWMLASVLLITGLAVVGVTAAPGQNTNKTVKATTPTYATDIAPILQEKCESCHRKGEVGPFALSNYEDAKKRASQIAFVTERGLMPPWKATQGYGEFHDEAAMTLTRKERETIQKWADAGAPLGDKKKLPKPKTFPSGWQLGEPDMILEPDREYELAAEGNDVYRHFVVKTNFTEDRYIQGVEVRPGNRAVVHHVIAYIDAFPRSDGKYQSEILAEKSKDGQPGYDNFGGPGYNPLGMLAGWAPGNEPQKLQDGNGIFVPKGARISLEVHYSKNGKVEKDKSRIGLHFSRTTVNKNMRSGFAINVIFRIPPAATRHEVKAYSTLSSDSTLYSVTPHMHLLGKEMKVWAVLPDGTEKPLVWIKDWDFNWQHTYTLKQPIKLPKGTKINLVAYYDNSPSNPRHPNKDNLKAVGWGESTRDEMCIAFFGFTRDEENLNHTPVPVVKQIAATKTSEK